LSDVTTIDIFTDPDASMLQHAQVANARHLKAFTKGYALSEVLHDLERRLTASIYLLARGPTRRSAIPRAISRCWNGQVGVVGPG
jgi:hypothetical protein